MLPSDIVKIISKLSGIKDRYLLDSKQLELVVDHDSDIITLSSQGTIYSGYNLIYGKCKINCECSQFILHFPYIKLYPEYIVP